MNDNVLEKLSSIIKDRKKLPGLYPYISKLYKKGNVKIANKLGEEAVKLFQRFLHKKNQTLSKNQLI